MSYTVSMVHLLTQMYQEFDDHNQTCFNSKYVSQNTHSVPKIDINFAPLVHFYTWMHLLPLLTLHLPLKSISKIWQIPTCPYVFAHFMKLASIASFLWSKEIKLCTLKVTKHDLLTFYCVLILKRVVWKEICTENYAAVIKQKLALSRTSPTTMLLSKIKINGVEI